MEGYHWYDFVGNIGVFLILLAYLLLQLNRIAHNSKMYCLLNCFGALLILVSLCFEFNLSAFTIELFWLISSLYGLLLNYRQKNTPRPQ